jgi:hypothetical protein
MLTPGLIYPGSQFRLAANFQDTNGADTDPATVRFRLMSPDWEETSYTYGTDAALVKAATGAYYIDITPDLSGRWWFRWETTGPVSAHEGEFLVQASAFEDQRYVRRRYSV